MNIQKNLNSVNKIQNGEVKIPKVELKGNLSSREVQKSVYEKGTPLMSGQYFNPSFGNAAVAKNTTKAKEKGILVFNKAIEDVKTLISKIDPDVYENDKIFERAKILESFGFEPMKATNFSKNFKTENAFVNFVAMLKCGVDPISAKELTNEKMLQKFNIILEKGDSINNAKSLARLNKLQEDAARKIMQADVPVEDAVKAVSYYYDEKELKAFSDKYVDIVKQFGQSEYNRAIVQMDDKSYEKAKDLLKRGLSQGQLAGQEKLFESENFKQISDIAASIANKNLTDTKNKNLLHSVENYLLKNPDINLQKFSKYLDSIDPKSLTKIDSSFENFSEKDWLKFADFHYKSGTKTFDKSTLSMPNDLTDYLRKNYLDKKGLSELFKMYPSTAREVGEMPSGWGVTSEKAKNQIYKAIESFQNDQDIGKFEKDLSESLNKKVHVEKLGNGSFGTGYKLSVAGSDDTCLKVFHKEIQMDDKVVNGSRVLNLDLSHHGQNIEPQTGLYVNEHSDDFVKMFFGKVAPNDKKDGFYVTQYIDDNVKPIKNKVNNKDNVKIIFGDMKDDNVKNGKIIDYGGVAVKDAEGNIIKWKVQDLLK